MRNVFLLLLLGASPVAPLMPQTRRAKPRVVCYANSKVSSIIQALDAFQKDTDARVDILRKSILELESASVSRVASSLESPSYPSTRKTIVSGKVEEAKVVDENAEKVEPKQVNSSPLDTKTKESVLILPRDFKNPTSYSDRAWLAIQTEKGLISKAEIATREESVLILPRDFKNPTSYSDRAWLAIQIGAGLISKADTANPTSYSDRTWAILSKAQSKAPTSPSPSVVVTQPKVNAAYLARSVQSSRWGAEEVDRFQKVVSELSTSGSQVAFSQCNKTATAVRPVNGIWGKQKIKTWANDVDIVRRKELMAPAIPKKKKVIKPKKVTESKK